VRPSAELSRDDRLRIDQASEWMLRLETESEDEAVISEWLEWYSNSDNQVAFDEMQRVQEDVRAIDRRERAAFAAMILHDQPMRRRFSGIGARWRRVWVTPRIVLLSSSLITVIALAMVAWKAEWPWADGVNASYRTERGVHRVVNVVDGSVITLGARSSLSLNFTRETRYLVLEGGEAFFKVAKDSARPFIVQAGPVKVKAVGTEFNIRRTEESTFVAVKEGSVEVIQESGESRLVRAGDGDTSSLPDASRAVRIGAGEQATATTSNTLLTVAAIAPTAITGWQQGRLEFVNEPLESVVATVNRYSKRDIVLTDPNSLGELRFTGIVMENRIDDWVNAIQEVFPLKAESTGKGTGTILLSPDTR
jgi:transmembrane sensor